MGRRPTSTRAAARRRPATGSGGWRGCACAPETTPIRSRALRAPGPARPERSRTRWGTSPRRSAWAPPLYWSAVSTSPVGGPREMVSGSAQPYLPLITFRSTLLEDGFELFARDGPADPGECALVLHLARAIEERGQRQPRQRAADADALDAGVRELRDRQRGVGGAHDDVHGAAHGGRDGADHRQVLDARRVEHVRAGLLERLQPLDGVVEIEPPVQQVLRSRGQHEAEWQGARHLDGGVDTLDGQVEVVDRPARVTGGVLDRAPDDARLGGQANDLGRVAGRV